MQLHNNCKNCCDCTYFAQTYQGLKRQWFLYKDVADLSEKTRNVYSQNRQRWLTQKSIREASMMRVRLSVDGNCKVRWGISLCNSGKCCISNITLYMIWIEFVNGVVTTPVIPQFSCLPTYIEGSGQCDGPATIVPIERSTDGNFQIYKWDYTNPQTTTAIYGRHCIPDCKNVPETTLKVRLAAWIVWENTGLDPTATGHSKECDYSYMPAYYLPVDVQNIVEGTGTPIPEKLYGYHETPLTVVSSVNPLCTSALGGSRCDCD